MLFRISYEPKIYDDMGHYRSVSPHVIRVAFPLLKTKARYTHLI